MMITLSLPLARARIVLIGALAVFAALAGQGAWAQADPPGRVGRLADMQGSVSWFDHEQGRWADAERNLPLTGGDRISTAPQGRAELRIGSTVLRLGAATELEVLRLDDERISVQLHSGSLALRVRSRETADETEVVTREAHLLPQRAGHYRFDRVDDTTQAGIWRGTLRIDEPGGFVLETGQRVDLWRQGRRGAAGELRSAFSALPNDAFGEWALRDDQRDERSASSRYVSPEMTGAEDLDRNGRWENHPEFGTVWIPLAVRPDWAPYRYGRWAWVQPWGWTWVDEAPWGFAPFHYGRWVTWRGAWCWSPGAYVARPVYAPALVAWIGGPHLSVSVQIGGGGPVGWVPLAPREVYQPYYRATPQYVERVNAPPPYRWDHPPGERRAGPVLYGNQGAPNGMTVVPREVLGQRQPIGRNLLDGRTLPPGLAQRPVASVAPPQSAMGPERRQAVDVPRPGEAFGPAAQPVRREERPAAPGAAVVVQPVQPVQAVQPPDPRGPRGPRDGDSRRDRMPTPAPALVQPPMQGQPQAQPQAQPQMQPQMQPQPQPQAQPPAVQQAQPRPAPAVQPAPAQMGPQPAPRPVPQAAAAAAPAAPAAAPSPPPKPVVVEREKPHQERERERDRDREKERQAEAKPRSEPGAPREAQR